MKAKDAKPRLRLATIRDAAAVQSIYAPYVRDTCISFEIEPPGVAEMAARIRKNSRCGPWLVCEWAGEVVGYAYASEHRVRRAYAWSVDAAVYVRAGFHRRGIGRALYGTLVALLRLQGFRMVYGGIYLPNPSSVGLHEAVGFRKVAVFRKAGFKLGGWRDVGWWELDLGKSSRAPRPAKKVAAIRHHPKWNDILCRGEAGLRS